MNIDCYRNYVQIVEQESLSAAARSLHIAQSALSMQLKQLEQEYGAVLFIRSSRHMELTDAGKILYEKSKNILKLLEASHKEISSCVNGAQGTLRIGMTQAYPDAHIEKLLLGFHDISPQINYEFYEVNSNEIIELLRAGVVEIGIVRTSGLLPPDICEAIQLKQRLCAYCSYNNPWITPYGKEIFLSSLDHVPLAISRGFVGLIQEVFLRSGVSSNIMSVSTSRNNPIMWAKAGKAIAIICKGAQETHDTAEAFSRPLTTDDAAVTAMLHATRSFVTLKDGSLSATAKKFIDYCSSKSYEASV